MHCFPTQLNLSIISSMHMEKSSIEERVSLKRLTSQDVKYFYEWASDPEVAQSMEAYTSLVDNGLITRWSLVQVQVAPLFKNPFTTVLKWCCSVLLDLAKKVIPLP